MFLDELEAVLWANVRISSALPKCELSRPQTQTAGQDRTGTHSSAGLTPNLISTNLPVSFSNMKWDRFVLRQRF